MSITSVYSISFVNKKGRYFNLCKKIFKILKNNSILYEIHDEELKVKMRIKIKSAQSF